MAGRRLGADERALWKRVIADVTPLPGTPLPSADPAETGAAGPGPGPKPKPPGKFRPSRPPLPLVPARPAAAAATRAPPPGETLDGGWDRRLRRGIVAPDATIDLHGHTLAQAQHALEQALQRALADGSRMLLLITGKPPRVRVSALDRPARGAIRAAVGDWLLGSRHASRIAAVRNAHPRHGGTGALYVILRRTRETG